MKCISRINLFAAALPLLFCAIPALSQYSGSMPTPPDMGVQPQILNTDSLLPSAQAPAQLTNNAHANVTVAREMVMIPAQAKVMIPPQGKVAIPRQAKVTIPLAPAVKPATKPVTRMSRLTAPANISMERAAPVLQGATNGTIGPMGGDAIYSGKSANDSKAANGGKAANDSEVTYVTGVCTAGTVRVNNLANLEALLNAATSLFQIGAAGTAIWLVSQAFLLKSNISPDVGTMRFNRFALALAFSLSAIFADDALNSVIMAARDANLFS